MTANLDMIKETFMALAPKYGVDRAFLFGSQARGDSDSASDIDLVVELNRPLGFKRGQLCIDVEAALGMPVDLVFGRESLSGPVRENFETEAVLVYES